MNMIIPQSIAIPFTELPVTFGLGFQLQALLCVAREKVTAAEL